MPPGIHIGTSGWTYDGWKGVFYPENIGADAMLEAYAGRFGTVEVNGTFYSLPKPETVEAWTSRVPEDFINCLNSRKSGKSVFCYFDNDEKARAPHDARRLIDRVRGK